MSHRILKVNNLKKSFSNGELTTHVLKGINFSLSKNEFVAIMGPSGSGKSTFLNCISTIDQPTSGDVFINGKNPYQLNDEGVAKFRRKELGFVFQDYNLVNTLTVKENIVLPLTLDSMNPAEMKKRLEIILDFLDIKKIENKRTHEISGGEKQRTAIARAIIHQPQLLIADEPTGNLDSKSVNSVMNLFNDILLNFDTSIIMVTHDAYVASFAERVVFIRDGELHSEIHYGDSKKGFYEDIMETLTYLGGGQNDL